MRIVFLGTPDFAVASLEALLKAGYDVPAVVTAPDKPAGRGRQLQTSAVKDFALRSGLRVMQPANLKDEAFLEELRQVGADLQVVVAFRMLPEAVWNMPPLGTYNLHASLLPQYRGAAPINRAIMNGETRTGVTTFKLKQEVDTGNILLQEAEEIGPDMTAGELHDRLRDRGARLLVRTVQLIADCASRNTEPAFVKQDDRLASHAPKIFREDRVLRWDRPNVEIHNQVRGLSPFPGAYCKVINPGRTGGQLKILRTSLRAERPAGPNGLLATDNGSFLRVSCATGSVDILELQLEGKKRMTTVEFLKGYRFSEGAGLSAGEL